MQAVLPFKKLWRRCCVGSHVHAQAQAQMLAYACHPLSTHDVTPCHVLLVIHCLIADPHSSFFLNGPRLISTLPFQQPASACATCDRPYSIGNAMTAIAVTSNNTPQCRS